MGDGSAEQILRSISNGTYRDFDRDPQSTHESVLIAAHNQRMVGLLDRFNHLFSGRHGLGAKVLGGKSDAEAGAEFGRIEVRLSRRFGEVAADLTDVSTGATMWFYNHHSDRPQFTMRHLVVNEKANPEAMLTYLEEGVATHAGEKLRGFTPVAK